MFAEMGEMPGERAPVSVSPLMLLVDLLLVGMVLSVEDILWLRPALSCPRYLGPSSKEPQVSSSFAHTRAASEGAVCSSSPSAPQCLLLLGWVLRDAVGGVPIGCAFSANRCVPCVVCRMRVAATRSLPEPWGRKAHKKHALDKTKTASRSGHSSLSVDHHSALGGTENHTSHVTPPACMAFAWRALFMSVPLLDAWVEREVRCACVCVWRDPGSRCAAASGHEFLMRCARCCSMQRAHSPA